MIQDDMPEGLELLDPEIVVPAALHLANAQTSGERIIATEWNEP
jgi:hypothetical protein